MIVARKPCTLYDVDLLGLVALAALGVAAWWFVVAPWQKTWYGYRELADQQAAVTHLLQNSIIESDRHDYELGQLRGIVDEQFRRVPQADALTRLLHQTTDLARDCHVELLSVAPQPVVHEGPYWVTDIRLVGRGTSRDFVHFLDRSALESPYQSLRTCSVVRRQMASDPTCELAWTVRLYLLPPGSAVEEEDTP